MNEHFTTAWSDEHPWKREALRKVVELAALPENWDGYGSRRLRPAARRKALELIELLSNSPLSAPQIFPVPGGGLQLEWQTLAGGAELEILPDGSLEYLLEDAVGEMCEGAAVDNEVLRWFERTASDIAEQSGQARLEALKKQKFTPEGREERIAKALATLNQPSTISLPEEEWKRIAEDPDLADQF